MSKFKKLKMRVESLKEDYFGVEAYFCHAEAFIACTKPYYLDVADDSRVCYVEKDFLSKVIC